jgi:hypothetical protein
MASVLLKDLHLEVVPFFTFNSLVSLPPPQPATTTENISPSDNMAIALVAFNFFIFAPIV